MLCIVSFFLSYLSLVYLEDDAPHLLLCLFFVFVFQQSIIVGACVSCPPYTWGVVFHLNITGVTMQRIKLIFSYGLLVFIILFCLLWFIDILSSSFNPEYRPLLTFLEITAKLLQVVISIQP